MTVKAPRQTAFFSNIRLIGMAAHAILPHEDSLKDAGIFIDNIGERPPDPKHKQPGVKTMRICVSRYGERYFSDFSVENRESQLNPGDLFRDIVSARVNMALLNIADLCGVDWKP